MKKTDIERLSYPDFIGFICQENTPPGSETTIEEWIEEGHITADSYLLDLACSTGFSSRSIVIRTGCRSAGIDISKPSIDRAKDIAVSQGISDKTEYLVGDAATLPFGDESFTHVAAGSCFGFIQERERALSETCRVLKNEGALLIASYYYEKAPPSGLLDKVEKHIGYRPDSNRTKDFWIKFFNTRFQLLCEGLLPFPPDTEEGIRESVRIQIFENEELRNVANDETMNACYKRLLAARTVLSEHRCYQGVSVFTWKKI